MFCQYKTCLERRSRVPLYKLFFLRLTVRYLARLRPRARDQQTDYIMMIRLPCYVRTRYTLVLLCTRPCLLRVETYFLFLYKLYVNSSALYPAVKAD